MRLEGDVSIKNIKSLYADIKDELTNNDEIIIEMKDVSSIDASVAQVLLSATLKAKETGKELRLENIPAELNKTLALAGLSVEKKQGETNE